MLWNPDDSIKNLSGLSAILAPVEVRAARAAELWGATFWGLLGAGLLKDNMSGRL